MPNDAATITGCSVLMVCVSLPDRVLKYGNQSLSV